MSQNYGGYDPNQPQGDQSGYNNQPPQGGYNNQPPQGGYNNQPPADGPKPNYSAPNFNQDDINKMMAQGRADLQLLPGKWMKVLSNPSPQTFASELPNANWVAIVTNVLVAAVATGVIFFLLFLLFGAGGIAFSVLFSTLWQTIFQFALGIGLAYAFSTYLFNGKGDIMQLSWALSLSGVPLIIARALIIAIASRIFTSGFLLALINLLFWLAVFYYLWMALQAVFKFNSQTAMYAALSTLALPLLGSVLDLFGWAAWLPGLFTGYAF